MNRLLEWISKNPAIAVALISGVFAILGGFFAVIVWPLVKTSLGAAWDKFLSYVSGKKFEHRYLDWVIGEHQFLPTLPTTLVPVTAGRHRQELDQLYVSLALAKDPQRAEETSLSSALNSQNRVVILGDPGAGKTTMLRFLALTFARARRKRSSSRDGSERKRAGKSIRQARKRVKEEFRLSHYPLPVLVYLNRLREISSWPKSYSLFDAVRDELKAIDMLRDFPESFFHDKLERGQCVFLFDAFDELGTQEARDAVARSVGELANAAPGGNLFIVTSRIVGYNGQLAKYGFSVLTVQRLTWELIRQLVTRWYELLDEPNLADYLLRTLKTNPRIYELAVNPMLLSLIVLVQYVKRLIPDRRHVLYDECVKILVERRYAPPNVQELYNQTLPGDEAVRILQKLALDLHEQHLREVPRNELETTLIVRVLKTMAKTRAAAISPASILRNIEERSQLLVERGLNEFGQPLMAFSHLTFQEFLASVALKEATSLRGDQAVTNALIESYEADAEWWEEVALLYAAQLNGEQRDKFFDRLYPQRQIGMTSGQR